MAGDIHYYPHPKNDNQKLLNAQYKVYASDKKQALADLYMLALPICKKLIHDERRKKGFYLDDIDDKAHDAALYIIRRYLESDTYYVKKNYIAALYDCVRHVLYHRRKVDMIVDFIDMTTCNK